jgi:hypothetical protein
MEVKKSDYDKQFNNLQDGECLMVFDFKQNLGLPMSPKEMSQEFFQKLPVSVLSFVCFIKKNNMLFKKVFTFLSLCLNHNATFASDCLERVLNCAMFDEVTKVYLWSDNGPHFHNNQFINFIFLKNNFKNKVIEYNFFCEKHGKAVCDQFFGSMTRCLNELSMNYTISNINELLSCLYKYYFNKPNEYFFEMFVHFFINYFIYFIKLIFINYTFFYSFYLFNLIYYIFIFIYFYLFLFLFRYHPITSCRQIFTKKIRHVNDYLSFKYINNLVVSIEANNAYVPADLFSTENKKLIYPSNIEKENIFYTEKNIVGKEFSSMYERRLKLCSFIINC